MADVVQWSSLISAFAGGVIATGGTLVAQWSADRRAERREHAAREHERETWARDHRKNAHISFLTQFEHYFTIAHQAYETDDYLPDEFLYPLYDLHTTLKMWAQPRTVAAAAEAMKALDAFRDPNTSSVPVTTARDAYLDAVRAEFGIA